MNQADYYKMQAIIDASKRDLEEMENLLKKNDPNKAVTAPVLPVATAPPIVMPAPSTVTTKPPRKPRSKTIIVGPVADAVNGVLEEQKEEDEASKGPKRVAPYTVPVMSVNPDPHNPHKYWARVFDEPNDVEGYVEVDKNVYDEFNQDPEGLVVDISENELKKMQWAPVNLPPVATS